MSSKLNKLNRSFLPLFLFHIPDDMMISTVKKALKSNSLPPSFYSESGSAQDVDIIVPSFRIPIALDRIDNVKL